MFLCLVFLMLSRPFVAALWSPAGKGLTSGLSLVMFIFIFLLLSHVVSWVRFGTLLYHFLIFVVFLTLINVTPEVIFKSTKLRLAMFIFFN